MLILAATGVREGEKGREKRRERGREREREREERGSKDEVEEKGNVKKAGKQRLMPKGTLVHT